MLLTLLAWLQITEWAIVPVYVPPTAAAGTATEILGSQLAVLTPESPAVPVTTVFAALAMVMLNPVAVMVPVAVMSPGA